MTCADCVYFIPEYGKHLKGCYLFPYKLTLGNDPACDKFIEGKEKSVKKTDKGKAESDLMNLLPCPFCGGIDLSCDGHYVVCDCCGATGPDIHPVPNGRKANELWNHRSLFTEMKGESR